MASDELISNVEVQISNNSLETSTAEAQSWSLRKTKPVVPLWQRATDLAKKEVAHAALKSSEKKKKSKHIVTPKMWWSSLELEKRKAMQVSPVVSCSAPDTVIHSAQRYYEKELIASKNGRKEFIGGMSKEMRSDHGTGVYGNHQNEDPFGLLDGLSSFIDVSTPNDIIDIYGLHDENTLVSVTPCKSISLLRPMSIPLEPADAMTVSLMNKTWSPTSNTVNDTVKLPLLENTTQPLKEVKVDEKVSKSTMSELGGGVGRLISRSSMGRALANHRSPPEPEGGDKDRGGTVGQLLEVWVWLTTSKAAEHIGGPVSMDPVVLAEFLQKKHLAPPLPAAYETEDYHARCVFIVERCARIIRMAQSVLDDQVALKYFLSLLLSESAGWAGVPSRLLETHNNGHLMSSSEEENLETGYRTELFEGDEGSTAVAWRKACEAVKRVAEDPSSFHTREEAKQLLLTVMATADVEEASSLVWQGRYRLRVRYELAALQFEEFMVAVPAETKPAERLMEELLQILALLSDPNMDPFDNLRRSHPSESPWFAPDNSSLPLVEVDEIRCMLAQLALHPSASDLQLAQHHYREIGGARYFPPTRNLLASDWPSPDKNMAWVDANNEDLVSKSTERPA